MDCNFMDLSAPNQDIEMEQGDTVNFEFRVKYQNGNPVDLVDTSLYFQIAYTEDTWNDLIWEGVLNNTTQNGIKWINSGVCHGEITIPHEPLMLVKFPLKQPKKLICKYRFFFIIEEIIPTVSKTLFDGKFIINRK